MVPLFSDVDVLPTKKEGQRQLVFTDRWSKEELDPNQVSDGCLLTLACLALAHAPDAPDLIAIEEPERGLHPVLIGEVISALRQLASGDMGTGVQVVLATHSAALLDHLEPHEVRFMRRDREGNTQLETATANKEGWAEFFRDYEDRLGDAWLSGGLADEPAHRGVRRGTGRDHSLQKPHLAPQSHR